MRRLYASALLGSSLLACYGDEDALAGPRPVLEESPDSRELVPEGREPDRGVEVPAPVSSLWCRALAVLRANCLECHNGDHVAGAPMSLLNYEDLLKPAFSDPSRRVYELVEQRIHDERDPMPQAGMLDENSLEALDAWIDDGARPGPDRSCTGGSTLEPSPTVDEPWPADCEEHYVLKAHDLDHPDRPYRVKAGEETQVRIPFSRPPWGDKSLQALALRPITDNHRVLHHWILYEGTGVENQVVFWGWAPGNAGVPTLPSDVGLHLGNGPMFLEMHYYNRAGAQDEDDASGAEICVTSKFREHTAAMSKDLSALPLLLPGQRAAVTSLCRVVLQGQEEIHILSVAPHMHKLGVHAYLGISHDYVEQVVHNGPFDFYDQRFYPAQAVIYNDDVVTTRCTYENATGNVVRAGETSDDEMCINFVLYWPKDGFFCLPSL
ncbi:MAG: hypothetical protein QM778_11800 [Myxococcales bacterium]